MAENKVPIFPTPSGWKLRLRTVHATKNTFARIIREYSAGNLDHDTFRNLIYGLSQYQVYLKLEDQTEFEKRVQRLETILCEKLPDGSFGLLSDLRKGGKS